MGGYFSSNSYLEERDQDDEYTRQLSSISRNERKRKRDPPSNIDLSDEFESFIQLGSNNIERTANYLMMHSLESINCFPEDFHEQCSEFKLSISPKNSLYSILTNMTDAYDSIRTLNGNLININSHVVHKHDIKYNIKDSLPVYISMGVNTPNYTATKHDPLNSSESEETDYALVGVLTGYQHNLFKILLGDGSYIFATKDYIYTHVHELWTITTNEVFDVDEQPKSKPKLTIEIPPYPESEIVKYTASFVSDSESDDEPCTSNVVEDEISRATAELKDIIGSTGQELPESRNAKKRSKRKERKERRKQRREKHLTLDLDHLED